MEELQSLLGILRAWLLVIFSKLVWGSYTLISAPCEVKAGLLPAP